jgi:hypothetical protein
MLVFLAIGCSEALPPLVCPEKAAVVETVPVAGGRAEWCARKDGSRNGPAREYRGDGTLWKTGTYLGVRKEGLFTWYHADGKTPMEQAMYAKNKLDGERIRWDEHGVELGREVWKEGERISGDLGVPPPK